jgi:uncharacterized OB-fold protein
MVGGRCENDGQVHVPGKKINAVAVAVYLNQHKLTH